MTYDTDNDTGSWSDGYAAALADLEHDRAVTVKVITVYASGINYDDAWSNLTSDDGLTFNGSHDADDCEDYAEPDEDVYAFRCELVYDGTSTDQPPLRRHEHNLFTCPCAICDTTRATEGFTRR